MYRIVVNNEYRNDGMGYPDDYCPMHYYIINNSDGDNVGESDWDYGFMTIEQACEVARCRTDVGFSVEIEGETHFFDAEG